MITIPISEPDGSDPLPICRAQRLWLVDRYKLDSMIALCYYTDDYPVKSSDLDAEDKARKHIRSCPKCVEWIHFAIPEHVLERQRRLAKYCCAGMFVAIEEPDNRNKIEFSLFRGEDPCWKIDGKLSFISYCPWCGKKLPNKPFVAS